MNKQDRNTLLGIARYTLARARAKHRGPLSVEVELEQIRIGVEAMLPFTGIMATDDEIMTAAQLVVDNSVADEGATISGLASTIEEQKLRIADLEQAQQESDRLLNECVMRIGNAVGAAVTTNDNGVQTTVAIPAKAWAALKAVVEGDDEDEDPRQERLPGI